MLRKIATLIFTFIVFIYCLGFARSNQRIVSLSA